MLQPHILLESEGMASHNKFSTEAYQGIIDRSCPDFMLLAANITQIYTQETLDNENMWPPKFYPNAVYASPVLIETWIWPALHLHMPQQLTVLVH